MPSISVADAGKVTEGRKLSFVISLSNAFDKKIRVNYATSDGTAVAGEDYEAKSGRATFQPGETEKTIKVKTMDDGQKKRAREFTLELSGATRGATIADGSAVGRIKKDKAAGKAVVPPYKLASHPNPFNSSTHITYNLSEGGDVRLAIYNLMGQQVSSLVNAFQSAGSYQVVWDARDVSAGIYIARLRYPGGQAVQRMLYLK